MNKMFITVFDEETEEKLKKSGFKLLNHQNDKAIFIYNKSIKFNFDKLDNTKYLLTNKLNF